MSHNRSFFGPFVAAAAAFHRPVRPLRRSSPEQRRSGSPQAKAWGSPNRPAGDRRPSGPPWRPTSPRA